MTATQINAMRTLWTAATTPAQTMTAREFELAGPYKMNWKSQTATKADGSKWVWVEAKNAWVKM